MNLLVYHPTSAHFPGLVQRSALHLNLKLALVDIKRVVDHLIHHPLCYVNPVVNSIPFLPNISQPVWMLLRPFLQT